MLLGPATSSEAIVIFTPLRKDIEQCEQQHLSSQDHPMLVSAASGIDTIRDQDVPKEEIEAGGGEHCVSASRRKEEQQGCGTVRPTLPCSMGINDENCQNQNLASTDHEPLTTVSFDAINVIFKQFI